MACSRYRFAPGPQLHAELSADQGLLLLLPADRTGGQQGQGPAAAGGQSHGRAPAPPAPWGAEGEVDPTR